MREEAGSEPLDETLATDEQLSLDVSALLRVRSTALELYANVRNLLDEHVHRLAPPLRRAAQRAAHHPGRREVPAQLAAPALTARCSGLQTLQVERVWIAGLETAQARVRFRGAAQAAKRFDGEHFALGDEHTLRVALLMVGSRRSASAGSSGIALRAANSS